MLISRIIRAQPRIARHILPGVHLHIGLFCYFLLSLACSDTVVAQSCYVGIDGKARSFGLGDLTDCGGTSKESSTEVQNTNSRWGHYLATFSAGTDHAAAISGTANLRMATFSISASAGPEYVAYNTCTDTTTYFPSDAYSHAFFSERFAVSGPFDGIEPVPVLVRAHLKGRLSSSGYLNNLNSYLPTSIDFALDHIGLRFQRNVGDPSLALEDHYAGQGPLEIAEFLDKVIYITSGAEQIDLIGYLRGSAFNGGACDASVRLELILPPDFTYTSESGVFPQPGPVGNIPPFPHTGGPYSIYSGEALVLNASGSVEPDLGDSIASYSWDFNGDGIFERTSSEPALTISASELEALGCTVGTREIHLWVTDSFGATDVAATTLTIQSFANQPPFAAPGFGYSITLGEDLHLSAEGSFDPDPGDRIVSYEWDLDLDGQFDDAIGVSVTVKTAHGSMHFGNVGVHYIDLRVTDTFGAIATFSTTVTVTDTTPPVISDLTISEITEISALITWTTDEPTTSELLYQSSEALGESRNSILTVQHSVFLVGLAPATTYTFVIVSTDGAGNKGPREGPWVFTTLARNQKPSASDLLIVTDEEVPASITLTGVDLDGDSLTFSVVSGPAHGTLSGTAPNLSYFPAADYYGADSFTFKVNDGSLDSEVATVNITVTPVNDTPVAVNRSISVDEDTAVSVTLTCTDADNDPLTFTITSGPTRGTLNGTAPNLTYTPWPHYFGRDQFSYRVSDGTASASATVSVTIASVNDLPIPNNLAITTQEDSPAPFTLPVADLEAIGYGVLQVFGAAAGDGQTPSGGLIEGSNGMIYGTTEFGGMGGNGTIFRVNKDGSDYAVLHGFEAGHGIWPRARLVEGPGGVLYGTTAAAGNGNGGTIWKMNQDGTGFGIVYHFNFSSARIPSGVTLASDGALYGTTVFGGAPGNGLVYKVGVDGSGFTVLHEFTGLVNEGARPYAQLVEGPDGALYGTTEAGGADATAGGTIFRIQKGGSGFTVLHSFPGGSGNGGTMRRGLLLGSDGALYGVTAKGGLNEKGTIFKIQRDGSGFQLLHLFQADGTQGGIPEATLVEGHDGMLYGGTSAFGGSGMAGTIYHINKDGSSFSILHHFRSSTGDGNQLQGELLAGTDGGLYGVTRSGTVTGRGALFKLQPEPVGLNLALALPSHGGLSGATTDYTYLPAPNFNGSDSLNYEVQDSDGATASGTVSIQVVPVNDSPVPSRFFVDQNTVYGAPYQLTIPQDTFTDVDSGQSLTYSAANLPPGITFNSATRVFSGTATVAGRFEVTLQATDNGEPPLSASITFIVNIGKGALIATGDELAKVYGTENPPLTGTLTGVVNGDNITASYSTTATTTSDAGVYTVFVALNDPDGKLGNYAVTKSDGALRILRAPQTITFGEIPPHVYGDAPFVVPVSASSGLPVTLTSSVASVATVEGNILTIHGAGSTQLTAYQAGNANYLPAQFIAVQYSIGKATPVLSWNAPDPITVGTPLTSDQLNASANVAGTFTYDPPEGTILPEGAGQSVSVTFTPADTLNYSLESASVLIDVLPFVPPLREANFEWARHFNEQLPGGRDQAKKMVIDHEGNVVVTGTSGTMRIGAGEIVTVKYDNAGNKLWEMVYDGGDDDFAEAIAVDLNGNLYIAGRAWESRGGRQDLVLVKYGPDGTQLWAFRHEVSNIYGTVALKVNSRGDVHVGSTAPAADGRVGFIVWKLNSSGEVLWTGNYNRSFSEYDYLRGIDADSEGNVYATGSSGSAGLSDCVTVKFDSEGNLLWAAHLERTQNLSSGGSTLVQDGFGGVYVGGSVQPSNDQYDSMVIRYSGSGDKLWEARYNGPANNQDYVRAIALDPSGNVIVTGNSYGVKDGLGSQDIFTIKYHASGSELWAVRYNGAANGWDDSASVVTDSRGQVYVIGTSGGSGAIESQGVVLAYDSDGDLLWSYGIENAGYTSWGLDLALSPDGDLYFVSGVSVPQDRFKYVSSDTLTTRVTREGETIWSQRYDSHQSAIEWPVGVAIDSNGNAIVAGASYTEFGTDFLTVKYDPVGNTVWSRHYRDAGDYYSETAALVVDAEGNSYVTGYSNNELTGSDFVTIKYDPEGTLLWAVRYNHNANSADQAASIAVDDLGNVYVLGTSWVGEPKMIVVKYSSAGELVWVAERDRAVTSPWYSRKSLAIDQAGNVVAAAGFYDSANRLVFGAVKYDANGQELWSFRNDQQIGASSSVRSLALDQAGEIVITGVVHEQATSTDWLTIKLSSEGVLRWERSFRGPESNFDEVFDMAVDNGRNIYLTGRTGDIQWGGGNVVILKYDTDGNELWVIDQAEPGMLSSAESLAVDQSGNVIVGAYSWPQTFPTATAPSFITLKYRADGSQSWLHRYTRESATGYWVSDLALDGRGGIYVVGETWGGSFDDLTTIKLSDPDVIPAPFVTALNPAKAVANGSSFILRVDGQNFDGTSVVHWNGEPLPTSFITSTQISAQIPAERIAGFTDISVVRIAIGQPGQPLSNQGLFTIVPSTVGDISISEVTSGQIGSASSISTSNDAPSVRVAVQNNGDTHLTVVAATYDSKPVGETAFRIGNGDFVDVQLTGASSGDVAGVLFYYPAGVTGSHEEKIKLRYFNGSDWIPVLSSGGTPPEKDSRDNLDGTTSGGRFSVIFDDTSTPKITELTGTIFGMFNPAPQILSVSGPNGPLVAGSTTTINVHFATPVAGQPCALNVAWDDGTITPVTSNTGTASVSHKFDAPGVYSVVVTVSDAEGGSTTQSFDYVVIYDPNGGFVTGGGWINSPIGALRSNPELKGEARFGFVSRYKKGSSIPSGQTEFQFTLATFTFKSTTYQWLVVSGSKTQYKGSGTINGAGEFGFLLTATDGEKTSGGSDRFRIKIWDIATGLIAYDNVLDAPDTLEAMNQQEIAGGSIVVHKQ